ncbi:hypothetical protein CDCA_CDCA12G3486 [Cyanidium caldarium]|uniref:Uncharacterized protein n=1 Tax=Cyanidium caldarium TaxID=2771 RepID=A0AAV9IZJ0_CYACA|nr:hypothetical protein CDCA_CDCA12G3486 [Cyanidium caldarium]|eukprot:ctg_93.g26
MFFVPKTVPAVVLDTGTRLCKAGFAGGDVPSLVCPSALGTYAGQAPEGALGDAVGNGFVAGYEWLAAREVALSGVQVRSAFDDDGLISDWAAYEALLDYCFARLQVQPEEYALCVVEPSHNPKRPREELCQVLFDKYNVPAVYFGRNAALSCFAAGRHTGVVLDCGASNVSATPVFEGAVVKHAILRTRVGSGQDITRRCAALCGGLECIRPPYAFRRRGRRHANDAVADGVGGANRPSRRSSAGASVDGDADDEEDEAADDLDRNEDGGGVDLGGAAAPMEFHLEPVDVSSVSESYAEMARMQVAEDVKHHVCSVDREYHLYSGAMHAADHDTTDADASPPPLPQQQQASRRNVPPIAHELPDGTTLSLGAERFRPAEALFGTLPHARTAREDRPFLAYLRQQGTLPASSKGVAGLVSDAIRRCEHAQHREMFAGVVLTGGTSAMSGLADRLQSELFLHYNRVKVHAAANPVERKYTAWTGASMLATFADFQNHWFTRDEYRENGAGFVHKRCP